jgi:hypothetical protein
MTTRQDPSQRQVPELSDRVRTEEWLANGKKAKEQPEGWLLFLDTSEDD